MQREAIPSNSWNILQKDLSSAFAFRQCQGCYCSMSITMSSCMFIWHLDLRAWYVSDPHDQLRFLLNTWNEYGVFEQLCEMRGGRLHLFRSLVDTEIGLASFDLQSRSGCCPLMGRLQRDEKGRGSHSQGLFVLACDVLLDGRINQRRKNI